MASGCQNGSYSLGQNPKPNPLRNQRPEKLKLIKFSYPLHNFLLTLEIKLEQWNNHHYKSEEGHRTWHSHRGLSDASDALEWIKKNTRLQRLMSNELKETGSNLKKVDEAKCTITKIFWSTYQCRISRSRWKDKNFMKSSKYLNYSSLYPVNRPKVKSVNTPPLFPDAVMPWSHQTLTVTFFRWKGILLLVVMWIHKLHHARQQDDENSSTVSESTKSIPSYFCLLHSRTQSNHNIDRITKHLWSTTRYLVSTLD